MKAAAFDRFGTLWFTGQGGVYGRVDPQTGNVQVWDAPRGPGPYGITATPDGSRVFYASLAGDTRTAKLAGQKALQLAPEGQRSSVKELIKQAEAVNTSSASSGPTGATGSGG